MISEIKLALTCVNIGAVIGVATAVFLPKLQPDWYKRMVSIRSLIVGLIALAVLTLFSAGHFVQARPYLGSFFACFATITFFVTSISGLRFLLSANNTHNHGWKPEVNGS